MIHLSIYLSIDLLLVALIISTGFSEGHVARRLQQAQFRLRIQIPLQILRFCMLLEPECERFGCQAPRNCFEIEANGTTKARLLSRSSKSHDFPKFSWFLHLQFGSQNHGNRLRKRRQKNKSVRKTNSMDFGTFLGWKIHRKTSWLEDSENNQICKSK